MTMFLSDTDIASLALTLKLSACAVILLLIVALPAAWLLNQTNKRLRVFIETLLMLPVVLPPTVLGFYFLLLLRPTGIVSTIWMKIFGGEPLLFSFGAMLIGSFFVGLPLVIQVIQNTFQSIGKDQWEMALGLGASKLDAFISVILPQARKGILTAMVLGFAHTMGQFGLLLMIGGNIPGKTRVVSISIYEAVETLDFSKAHTLSLSVVFIAFICLLSIQLLNKSKAK